MKKTIVALFLLLVSIHCQARHKRHYGRHIVMASAVLNNGGEGFGLQYEYVINETKTVSVYIPFMVCITPELSHTSSAGPINAVMYFINPGFRIFPTSSKGVVRYSIGLSALMGFGEGRNGDHVETRADLTSRAVGGLLLVNALHFQPTTHIRISLEIGIGLGSDDQPLTQGNFLGQLSAGLGYRF